jgi:alpha-galactosidase
MVLQAKKVPGMYSFRRIFSCRNAALCQLSAAAFIHPCIVLVTVLPFLATTASDRSSKAQIQSGDLRVEFDGYLGSRIVARFGGRETAMGPFTASEFVSGPEKTWTTFSLTSQHQEHAKDAVGEGTRLTVEGKAGALIKRVTVTMYDEFPTMAFFDVHYTNGGKAKIRLTSWTSNAYTVNAHEGAGAPAFWSYQSGSYEKRPNWVLPLHSSFHQENYQGMNASDYGGGTPVVDVWRRDLGIAVGTVERRPRLVSLPVSMPGPTRAKLAVRYNHDIPLDPGQSFSTFRTFVSVHRGDYFGALVAYRRFMTKLGMQMATAPDDAFGAIWCAWGYGRTVQPKQVYATLPVVKRLGFTWVTLDDGWQNNVGDWQLDPKKFPNGDADMKALVDRIHQEGSKRSSGGPRSAPFRTRN